MSRAILVVLLCLLAGVFAPARAEDTYRQQMKGLDEQVQEVKSDVLSIAAELNQLQERLLYPSDTQLAVFVALAKGETLRLDAVQIQIDGQPVANYIYSFKELEALQKGGVQRIYTGNIATGEHASRDFAERQARERQGLHLQRALRLHESRQTQADGRHTCRARLGPARDRARGLVSDGPFASHAALDLALAAR